MNSRLFATGTLCLFLIAVGQTQAGGCVGAHALGNVGCGLENLDDKTGKFEFTLGFRNLHSDRHFRGAEEEPERQRIGNNVINNVNSYDLGLTYWKNNTWSFQVALPVIFSGRSSLQDRVHRSSVHSKGVGDMRLMAYHEKHYTGGERLKGLTWGLGLKLPTGDYEAQDTFNAASGPETRYVDQSIQPGDGGVGVITALQGFTQVANDRNYLYFSGSYLINPRETNGTPTHRSRANEAITSVPDAYQARMGYQFVASQKHSWNLDGSVRIEGVPDVDLIGGSEGFRRPGYAVYAEIGTSFDWGPARWGFSIPVAIQRERIKSVQDRENGIHGDAAFADYLLLANVAYRF